MFCRYCGADATGNFCSNCGRPINQKPYERWLGYSEPSVHDDLLSEAARICLESGTVSISLIQRTLRTGYARAARLIDQLEESGFVSRFNRGKARRVFITRAEHAFLTREGFFDDPRKRSKLQKLSANNTAGSYGSVPVRLDGESFEKHCAKLLEKNGFCSVEITKRSGDQGVDIVARKDDILYAIQCKSYSSPLGNAPIQEVYAGKLIYGCHVGVVMTNSTFTKDAITAGEKTGVLLWGRDKLLEMEGT